MIKEDAEVVTSETALLDVEIVCADSDSELDTETSEEVSRLEDADSVRVSGHQVV